MKVLYLYRSKRTVMYRVNLTKWTSLMGRRSGSHTMIKGRQRRIKPTWMTQTILTLSNRATGAWRTKVCLFILPDLLCPLELMESSESKSTCFENVACNSVEQGKGKKLERNGICITAIPTWTVKNSTLLIIINLWIRPTLTTSAGLICLGINCL